MSNLPEGLPAKARFEAAGFENIEDVRSLNGDYTTVAGIGDQTGVKVDEFLAALEATDIPQDPTSTETETDNPTPAPEGEAPTEQQGSETEQSADPTTQEDGEQPQTTESGTDTNEPAPSAPTDPAGATDSPIPPESTAEELEPGEVQGSDETESETSVQLGSDDPTVKEPVKVEDVSPERYKGLHRRGNTRTR